MLWNWFSFFFRAASCSSFTSSSTQVGCYFETFGTWTVHFCEIFFCFPAGFHWLGYNFVSLHDCGCVELDVFDTWLLFIFLLILPTPIYLFCPHEQKKRTLLYNKLESGDIAFFSLFVGFIQDTTIKKHWYMNNCTHTVHRGWTLEIWTCIFFLIFCLDLVVFVHVLVKFDCFLEVDVCDENN